MNNNQSNNTVMTHYEKFAAWCNEQLTQQAPVVTKKLGKVKFNIYDFVATEKHRPVLQCAYHDGGVVVASDGYVLITTKDGYSADLDGRAVKSDGELMNEKVRYRNWRGVIPKDNVFSSIDTSQLLRFLNAIKPQVSKHKKEFGKKSQQLVALKIGDLWRAFYYDQLVKVAKGGYHIGANRIGVHEEDGKPVILRNSGEEECVLVMPVWSESVLDPDCENNYVALYDGDGCVDGQKTRFVYNVEKWVKVKTEQVVEIWAESEEEAQAIFDAGKGTSTAPEFNKKTAVELTEAQNDGQPTTIITRTR